MIGTPSLIIEGNSFYSENLETRLRIAERIIVKNNVFKSHLHINNANNNLKFHNNIFEEGVDFGGTNASQNDIEVYDNKIYSTNTDPCLEIESRAASSNVLIASNKFHQTGGGSRALYVRNNGAQPDDFVLMHNDLMLGTPTEFITFTGDNSLIRNNYNVPTRDEFSATVIGTGNEGDYEPVVTESSTARTSQQNDKNSTVRMNNALVNTYTIAPFSSVPIKVGQRYRFRQIGSGITTIVAGLGVTLNGLLVSPGQHRSGYAICVAEDEFDVTWI